MKFNVRVVFTGICAFTPDKPFKDTPKEVLAVIPDGWSKTVEFPSKAQDGLKLRRHRPYVKIKGRSIGATGLLSDADIVWYLKGNKLDFGFTGAPNDFTLGNIAKLCSMVDVAEDYSVIDAELLKFPPPTAVAAQVFFNKGKISAERTYGEWVFPSTLSKTKKSAAPIATEVIVFFQDVETFKLIFTPFNTEVPVPFDLQGSEGATLEIVIANLCDENPLRWETDVEVLPTDDDFKWYFELLSQEKKDSLPDELDGLPLPVPHFKGKLNGQGINCVPVEMKR